MTDTTAQFLIRSAGAPAQVLGVRLRPFTFGHAQLLARASSWRPLEALRITPQDLVVGLFICSRPWTRAHAQFGGLRSRLFARTLGWKVRLSGIDLIPRIKLFADYLEFHTATPEIRVLPQPSQARGQGRPMGTPFLARLQLFALEHLHLSRQDLGDLLFSELTHLWAYHHELAGSLALVNDDDLGFRAWCDEQDEQARTN